MNQNQTSLNHLLNKQAIYEAVLRYCRGIDRLDMATVRSAYHPDGVDHHTGFDGPIDAFIAWVEPLLQQFGGTRHDIGNHFAEIKADKAVAESYGIARHWGDEPALNFTTAIRYVDYFENRNGRWGIVERFAVREWLRQDQASDDQAQRGQRGMHGGLDIVDYLKTRL